jgi:hypothetical protein
MDLARSHQWKLVQDLWYEWCQIFVGNTGSEKNQYCDLTRTNVLLERQIAVNGNQYVVSRLRVPLSLF